ncbi:MAG: hypothetical protein IKP37_08750 [Paludibacteraceae bacterium]|nr:hypothetical protein [Paludibacteraceae bacterium]
MKHIVFSFIFTVLFLCSCNTNSNNSTNSTNSSDSSNTKNEITAETAYEGVNNYCKSTYDWSAAEENPSIMYLKQGEETDSTYQVIFRSYTGAFVYFYVQKTDGVTKMVEHVPSLNIENEAGSFNLFDYLKKD